MADNDRFRILFDRYATKEAEIQEREELFTLIGTGEYTSQLDQLIDERWDGVIPEWVRENDAEKAELNFEAIMQRVKVRRMAPYRRTAIAAAVILLIGAAAIVGVLTNNHKTTPQIANQEPRFKNDVDPGKYKARLTLADGTVVILDSAETGQLAQQGNTVVINKDGQIVYIEKGQGTDRVLYNSLSTARGETYATVLADGTRVWLNSASSIKYPVVFVGKERRVIITGEAYFEVAHNASKPFHVEVNGLDVQVLGTHFNINSYSDEPVTKTTLLEGSIKLTNSGKSTMLSPGQQIQLASNGEMNLVRNADVDQAVAWKNGVFDCNGLNISDIMRQVGRWYDVEIKMEPGITQDKFVGRIPRTVTLANLLKVLELNGVKFSIDGKKITVMK
jgi:ferric-dicitrate binding protein FerR (iron transport regulator)